MLSKSSAIVLGLVVGGLLGLPGWSSPSRVLQKRKEQLVVDGAVRATWTFIVTADGRTPVFRRWLYEDEAGGLLVIRDGADGDSIEHVGTGETIVSRFSDESGGRVEVRIGGSSLRLSTESLRAAMRASHGTLPLDVRAQAATMLSRTRPEFQQSVKALATLACSNPELEFELVLYSVLFAENGCAPNAPTTSMVDTLSVVAPFDPLKDRPDEFERRFGGAYLE